MRNGNKGVVQGIEVRGKRASHVAYTEMKEDV